MRYASLTALAALTLLSVSAEVSAQAGPTPQPGNCQLGVAQADLSPNDVFARVFNTGSLFFGNDTDGSLGKRGYVVPKATGFSSVFASGIWIGGQTGPDNTLRVAAALYDEYNFWPGPLGSDGRPVNPNDCSAFDRIYQVSIGEIVHARNGASNDASEWPVELGAPYFIDTNNDARRNSDEPRLFRADGDVTPINFAAGERPDIVGDEGVWWVMNDVGGPHADINSIPLGVEVRVLAWAFSRSDALGQTTFYRYTIVNKSGQDINNTYVGVFSDPDLGDFEDDYVGSDPEIGLGFVFNAVANDAEYGIPPALGYDFFQGPVVADRGDPSPENPDFDTDNLPDTLGTTAISYFKNEASPAGNPAIATDYYNYMQGLWADGTEMRSFGDGFDEGNDGEVTKFMFPGDPVTGQPWSETNPGAGQAPNEGGDRRFAIHTGPFVLENGDQQDIVFGIVFAQGGSNLNSVTTLRAADVLAQTAYDADFQLAPPPPSPPACIEGDPVIFPGSGNCLEGVSQNGQVTLVWGYPPDSPNYLGQFELTDALLAAQDVPDRTYNFEGFNVYRYPNSNFSVTDRELVATYDVINGVTTVREIQFDPELGQERLFVTARGTDSGVRYSYDITGLTNFQDYFYGVSAYAYNEFSIPQINEQQPTNIVVRPSTLANSVTTRTVFGEALDVTPVGTPAVSNGIRAQVVNPTAVTGDNYRVEFFRATNPDQTISGITTYRVINTTTNAVVLDGQEYFNRTGRAFAQGAGRGVVVDGLQLSINGDGGFETFITTENARGVISFAGEPLPEYTALRIFTDETLDFPFIPDSLGTPNGTSPNNTSPRSVRQQASRVAFAIEQGINSQFGYPNFLRAVTRNGENFSAINGDSYEWRFVGTTSTAFKLFDDRSTLQVPFELWNIGTTVDDTSDDYRLIPVFRPAADVLADDGTVESSGTPDEFNLGPIDYEGSSGANDPLSDQVFWYQPKDATPGQSGYAAYNTPSFNDDGVQVSNVTPSAIGPQIFAGMVLVGYNARNVPGPYTADVPEVGTIMRIVTTQQNRPGDAFTFSTQNLNTTETTLDGQVAALDRIAAVPNPYLGSSAYETGNISSIIRFANLPPESVTIRIFTVSGSLVNTLRKEGSARSLDWNLQTSNNLPVASGMYLVHVDVTGVGERTLKLGIVNRRTQIRAF